jgi:hypothetical protein
MGEPRVKVITVAARIVAARRSFSDSCTGENSFPIVLIMARYAYENGYYPQITQIFQRERPISVANAD